ncbi:MAG: prepilin-type N-terminal cleavage/methylation domain-containing protein [Thiocapsa sp. C3-sup]|uniref:type IV pilus modification PilV family protein n=2 Tax=Thiocapsa TaxID=1056 RepID=UPI0035B01445
MHSRSRSARTHGFTLVEALIALVVLSLGLFGLMQIQMRVMAGASDTKARTTAINLAQQKLEELRAGDYHHDDLEQGTHNDSIPAAEGGTSDFSREWIVTDHSSPTYKEISITLSWTTAQQDERGATFESATLTTYIAQSTSVELNPIGK